MKQILNNISRITLSIMREGRGVGLLLMTLLMMVMSPQKVWAEEETIETTVTNEEDYQYNYQGRVVSLYFSSQFGGGDGGRVTSSAPLTISVANGYIITKVELTAGGEDPDFTCLASSESGNISTSGDVATITGLSCQELEITADYVNIKRVKVTYEAGSTTPSSGAVGIATTVTNEEDYQYTYESGVVSLNFSSQSGGGDGGRVTSSAPLTISVANGYIITKVELTAGGEEPDITNLASSQGGNISTSSDVATITGLSCQSLDITAYEVYIKRVKVTYEVPCDHQLTAHPAVDVTCTTAGNSAYWSCSVCGKYFNDDEGKNVIEKDSWVIPATGHSIVNGECTKCSFKLTYRVPTYNTAGDATSGIASWSTMKRTEAATQVTSSTSQVTWNAGWYFVSGNVTLTQGAVCNGAVHLILCDGAKLTVTNSNIKKAGINVTGTNSLTIYAQSEGASKGVLEATGGNDEEDGISGAGIGGGEGTSGSYITINGGNVTANGRYNAAAIGGSELGSGSYITINGGYVTANGGYHAAAIGGGSEGEGSFITINGGNVTAKGGSWAAGIGGGWSGSGKNITINGGVVTATGGEYDGYSGAGIGNGDDCDTPASNIYISTACGIKAGDSANPTDEITNNGGDLASLLAGKQYAIVHKHIYKSDGTCVVCGLSVMKEPTLLTAETAVEKGLSADYAGYYAIQNAGQLTWFANKVNTENATYKAAKAVLTDNIDLSAVCHDAVSGVVEKVNWTPIGNSYYKAKYQGVFDGNGKEVSGLYIDGNVYTAALIGNLVSDDTYKAEVKNLTVRGSVTTTDYRAAGIVGYSEKSSISNCTNYVNVANTQDYIGGVAGLVYSTDLTNCSNHGNVTSTSCYVGGIAGQADGDTNITGCCNTGSIESTLQNNDSYVGGIVGYAFLSNTRIISGCYNEGNIKSARKIIGGLFGQLQSTVDNIQITVKNCYNTGAIECGGSLYVGGLIGLLSSPDWASDCNFTLQKLYNTGTITITNPDKKYGDIVGMMGYQKESSGGVKFFAIDVTASNIYYTGSTACSNLTDYSDAVGNAFIQKSADQFASGEVAWLLNGKTSVGTAEAPLVWYQDLSADGDSSPVLKSTGSNTVYYGYDASCTLTYANSPLSATQHVDANTDGYCDRCEAGLDVTATLTKVGNKYYTSFGAPYIYYINNTTAEGKSIKAYVATAVGNGVITMTEVGTSAIPAGKGVVIVGTDTSSPATMNVTISPAKSAEVGNDLLGATTAGMQTEGNAFFSVVNGVVGFYAYNSQNGAVPAGRAYLPIPATSGAKGYTMVFEDGTTGINNEQLIINNEQLIINNDGKFIENGQIVIIRNGRKYNVNGQVIK